MLETRFWMVDSGREIAFKNIPAFRAMIIHLLNTTFYVARLNAHHFTTGWSPWLQMCRSYGAVIFKGYFLAPKSLLLAQASFSLSWRRGKPNLDSAHTWRGEVILGIVTHHCYNLTLKLPNIFLSLIKIISLMNLNIDADLPTRQKNRTPSMLS